MFSLFVIVGYTVLAQIYSAVFRCCGLAGRFLPPRGRSTVITAEILKRIQKLLFPLFCGSLQPLRPPTVGAAEPKTQHCRWIAVIIIIILYYAQSSTITIKHSDEIKILLY